MSILWRLLACFIVALVAITWLENAEVVVVKIGQTAKYSNVAEQTGNCVSAQNAMTSHAQN